MESTGIGWEDRLLKAGGPGHETREIVMKNRKENASCQGSSLVWPLASPRECFWISVADTKGWKEKGCLDALHGLVASTGIEGR